MTGALCLLGFVIWVVACERLIMRHIDNSLMTPFEADLRAKRAKQEKQS